MAHAHERGVIHGDLKPANILIRNDGEPALIDFNLSTNFERESAAWAGGTLPYMSPEQLQLLLGQTTRIGASTDVYSWGVILFEFLENRLPYPPPLSQAESDVKIAIDNRQQSVAFSNPTTTAGFKAILRKCLSFAPEDRYADALTLLEDVEREFANRPLLHARENLFNGRVPKMLRRYPRFFSAGPIALLSLVIIGLLASAITVAWKKNNVLNSQARATSFNIESRRLLAEMVDPDPSQWPPLLAESVQLTAPLLGRKTDPSKSRPRADWLEWLSLQDRTAAQFAILEFCIATAALRVSSAAELTRAEREQLHQLLSQFTALSDSLSLNALLNSLRELLQHDTGQVSSRYESTMRALEKRLDAADSHYLIALLQARTDVRQGQARQAMERLQCLDVNHLPAHLYWMILGDAESQLGQLESALQSYGLAIGVAPKSVGAFIQRAEILQRLRKFGPAEEDYSRAIALAPSLAAVYMRRALVREKLRDIDGAIQDLDAALEFQPASNRLWLTRARMHRLANDREKYLADFNRGLTSPPQDIDDWVSRALAHLPREPERAKADLNSALSLQANSILALQNLAHVESEYLHNLEGARAALDQILELSPENEAARAGRCVLLARQGHTGDCLRDLEWLSHREQKLAPSTFYQMACAYALISPHQMEHAQRAIRLLALAIRHGYGADLLSTDVDLDNLRTQDSFVGLLTVAEFYKSN